MPDVFCPHCGALFYHPANDDLRLKRSLEQQVEAHPEVSDEEADERDLERENKIFPSEDGDHHSHK
jgi:hypothetical protein